MPMRKLLLGLAIAAVVAGGAFYFLQAQPESRPPAQALQPLPADQRAELEKWWDLQPQVALPFKTDPARVVIVKFNDFQCPPCRATYFSYEAVLAKYRDRPDDVRFVLKHFPLNPSCNPVALNLAHPAACDAAAAYVMASKLGTADRLADWFFVHQDELTRDKVREGAKSVGGIDNFDAAYAQAIEQVKADAAAGGTLKVESTPTFYVNGRKVAPPPTPAALDALIEYELKKQSR